VLPIDLVVIQVHNMSVYLVDGHWIEERHTNFSLATLHLTLSVPGEIAAITYPQPSPFHCGARLIMPFISY
jgi:hypothetical protein